VDGVTEGTQLGKDVGVVGRELGNADGNDVGIVDGRDEGCAVEHTNDDPEPVCKYPTEHVHVLDPSFDEESNGQLRHKYCAVV